jgi:signal transduction histidine kinase
MIMDGQENRATERSFPARINCRLSLFFGFLILVILGGGGVNLYLSYSIFRSAKEIKWQSDQIDVTDRIHSTIHHFLSALHRATIFGRPMPEDERVAYLQAVTILLELERHHETKEEREVIAGMRDLISYLGEIARKVPELTPQELATLSEVELRIQGLAHILSAAHRAEVEGAMRENGRKMKLSLAFYAAFVLLGVLFVIGSSLVSYRTIAQPLRSLADAAREIAGGRPGTQVAVTSKDEIGELSHAFNVMVQRLKEHEERLTGLATLEERERLAQEFHDSLAQNLAVLQLKLAKAERDSGSTVPAVTKETLSEMRQIVDSVYDGLRQAIFGLRIMASTNLGLIPTLTEYLHDFSASRGIPADLKMDTSEAIRLLPRAETQLVRIIHEALTNTFKHSAATWSEVKFARAGDYAKVTIEDNGKGFFVDKISGEKLHFGLQTMKERAESVGGKLNVDSAPGKGTRIVVFLPVAEASQ